MGKILIILDYRNQFYSSTKHRGASLDYKKIGRLLADLGYEVLIKNYSNLFLSKNDYKDYFVLYQSSEDPGLNYKSYIEDILLGLMAQGAKLIPDFQKFRAHHNKVFMEILRDLYKLPGEKVESNYFGTLEEYLVHKPKKPFIVKASYGSKSNNVELIEKRGDERLIKKISRTNSSINLRLGIKSLLDGRGFLKTSSFRKKFITQKYIKGLSGDYKILVYKDKYYVLKRENRLNDFRASGSGKFKFLEEIDVDLLNFSEDVFKNLNSPFASLDVARKNKKFYLLEFQCVLFGQYTIEKSKGFFRKNKRVWEIIKEKSDVENEFVNSVDYFIKTNFS